MPSSVINRGPYPKFFKSSNYPSAVPHPWMVFQTKCSNHYQETKAKRYNNFNMKQRNVVSVNTLKKNGFSEKASKIVHQQLIRNPKRKTSNYRKDTGRLKKK